MDEEIEKILREHSGGKPVGGSERDLLARKARNVVYLVAAVFLLIGALNLSLYLFQCHHNHADVRILRCLWLSIPLVIGVAILIKSSALAGRIEDWLEQ